MEHDYAKKLPKNQNYYFFAQQKYQKKSFNSFHSGGATQENELIRSVADAPFFYNVTFIAVIVIFLVVLGGATKNGKI